MIYTIQQISKETGISIEHLFTLSQRRLEALDQAIFNVKRANSKLKNEIILASVGEKKS